MKTFILIITFLGLVNVVKAQTNIPSEGLELSKKLNLSTEQIAKIKELNKGIDKQFAEIGKNSSLSGREKGEKKRSLALKHKEEILAVLTPEQITIWEKYYNKKNEGIKNSLTNTLDEKLDILERNYEKEKKDIEKDRKLSKNEKKEMQNALKAKYKSDKERLKNEKRDIENSILLNE